MGRGGTITRPAPCSAGPCVAEFECPSTRGWTARAGNVTCAARRSRRRASGQRARALAARAAPPTPPHPPPPTPTHPPPAPRTERTWLRSAFARRLAHTSLVLPSGLAVGLVMRPAAVKPTVCAGPGAAWAAAVKAPTGGEAAAPPGRASGAAAAAPGGGGTSRLSWVPNGEVALCSIVGSNMPLSKGEGKGREPGRSGSTPLPDGRLPACVAASVRWLDPPPSACSAACGSCR